MCIYCPSPKQAIRTLCDPKNERRMMRDDEVDCLLQFIQHAGDPRIQPAATAPAPSGGDE